MRVKPLVGQKLWFAPRHDLLGWGWTPVSWEGWTTVAAAVVAIVVAVARAENQPAGGRGTLGWVIAATLLLLVICSAKGTTPGGRKRFEEYQRLTNR